MIGTTTRSETSLTVSTEAMRERLREQLGDLLDEFDAGAETIARIDFAARVPGVGDPAPPFVLPDARGRSVALADLLAERRVLLVFYRGAWCPYCNLQLRAFQDALDELATAGLELVAVSPQTPDASLSMAEKKQLAFPVLSDAGNAVARAYGLVFTLDAESRELYGQVGLDLSVFNGDGSWELPAPAVFVVEQNGTVSYASVAADYRWRVGPKEVLAVVGRPA